ncbi:hypothetical protein E2C01_061799 [Portunus trituberculatus]|uniref:Uncharacterized protein n=1 Tax=Portunus trituberculatus TaxID=210409 RepID=A0A5B7H948_PORTR|nr:hypothetical protein [Portunus trituberculatus]
MLNTPTEIHSTQAALFTNTAPLPTTSLPGTVVVCSNTRHLTNSNGMESSQGRDQSVINIPNNSTLDVRFLVKNNPIIQTFLEGPVAPFHLHHHTLNTLLLDPQVTLTQHCPSPPYARLFTRGKRCGHVRGREATGCSPPLALCTV